MAVGCPVGSVGAAGGDVVSILAGDVVGVRLCGLAVRVAWVRDRVVTGSAISVVALGGHHHTCTGHLVGGRPPSSA